ncbi:hypothetical protein [Mariniblastus fucicola]|uniref:Uncharacterized protein n=1 Tax=Mariniblastus fucicola TaxID=980251 RepID=A0A5B9PCU3_9BACT|nr:hypothetical protein [Mariniblastus fucicola]QEG24158.1 hypothetical protein MFFC18_40740 [Mariniblastus fucicola]
MDPNPYRSPETSSQENRKENETLFSSGMISAMLWSNIGLVAAYLLFFGFDWIFVSWISPNARQVNIAWSKLLFILVGANVIIYFAFTNKFNGTSGSKADSDGDE